MLDICAAKKKKKKSVFSSYLETSLRYGRVTYYRAQNCLMRFFRVLMQQANRKTAYCSPRERVYTTIRPVSTLEVIRWQGWN